MDWRRAANSINVPGTSRKLGPSFWWLKAMGASFGILKIGPQTKVEPLSFFVLESEMGVHAKLLSDLVKAMSPLTPTIEIFSGFEKAALTATQSVCFVGTVLPSALDGVLIAPKLSELTGSEDSVIKTKKQLWIQLQAIKSKFLGPK